MPAFLAPLLPPIDPHGVVVSLATRQNNRPRHFRPRLSDLVGGPPLEVVRGRIVRHARCELHGFYVGIAEVETGPDAGLDDLVNGAREACEGASRVSPGVHE